MMLEAVCLLSLMGYGHGFLMYGSTTGWRRRQDGNLKGLMKLETAAGTVVDEEVLISFKPSEVEVVCKPGEVALEVAQRCSGMVEDNKNPFCRDGGCYNCEVEVVEATELGLEDNLVRACMFKVPEGAKKITLIQMSSDEAFEDMV